MKKVLLFGLLFLAVTSYGQIRYKTDFEKATERMGVVYSITTQDVGEFAVRYANRTNVKAKCMLNTFESADTHERAQDFSIQLFTGLFTTPLRLNCTEIDDFISAINKIRVDSRLRYIAKTANVRFRGSNEKGLEDMIALDLPADGSTPGDFEFVTRCYFAPDELINLFESVKALAD